jgi:hypothetical protein
MPISSSNLKSHLLVLFAAALLGCNSGPTRSANKTPPAMHDVPAVRLNYKYEPDVPGPTSDANKAAAEQRNAAVQADFDASRPQELLDRTLESPDKKYVLAVYHRVTDTLSEYRLDMYSPDGKPLKKLTSDMMAVHFPDTIQWSPDSNTLAFVAMLRVPQAEPSLTPPPPTADETETETGVATPAAPALPAPTGILVFRTEQLYICAADGSGVKPLTQSEGLIYFYYVWSPDSSMLASLATTAREWKYFETLSMGKGELLVPQGRPRIIEKNGRERRLDDNQTAILPVWPPDSSKVAVGFSVEVVTDPQHPDKKRRDMQIRIYDAAGTNPTQAAIPLRNQLLISSAAYDRDLHQLESSNSVPDNTAQPTTAPAELSTLPDESELVSYNPIVEIAWTADDLLYFKTAYVKRMVRESDNVTSFARWHRLILSAQAPAATPK